MTEIKLEDLVKLTTGGRITIPIKMRRKEGIEKGDYVWVIIQKPSFEARKDKIGKKGEKQK